MKSDQKSNALESPLLTLIHFWCFVFLLQHILKFYSFFFLLQKQFIQGESTNPPCILLRYLGAKFVNLALSSLAAIKSISWEIHVIMSKSSIFSATMPSYRCTKPALSCSSHSTMFYGKRKIKPNKRQQCFHNTSLKAFKIA